MGICPSYKIIMVDLTVEKCLFCPVCWHAYLSWLISLIVGLDSFSFLFKSNIMTSKKDSVFCSSFGYFMSYTKYATIRRHHASGTSFATATWICSHMIEYPSNITWMCGCIIGLTLAAWTCSGSDWNASKYWKHCDHYITDTFYL